MALPVRDDWELEVMKAAKEEGAPFTGSPSSLLSRLRKRAAELRKAGYDVPENYTPSFVPEERQLWLKHVNPVFDASKAPKTRPETVPSRLAPSHAPTKPQPQAKPAPVKPAPKPQPGRKATADDFNFLGGPGTTLPSARPGMTAQDISRGQTEVAKGVGRAVRDTAVNVGKKTVDQTIEAADTMMRSPLQVNPNTGMVMPGLPPKDEKKLPPKPKPTFPEAKNYPSAYELGLSLSPQLYPIFAAKNAVQVYQRNKGKTLAQALKDDPGGMAAVGIDLLIGGHFALRQGGRALKTVGNKVAVVESNGETRLLNDVIVEKAQAAKQKANVPGRIKAQRDLKKWEAEAAQDAPKTMAPETTPPAPKATPPRVLDPRDDLPLPGQPSVRTMQPQEGTIVPPQAPARPPLQGPARRPSDYSPADPRTRPNLRTRPVTETPAPASAPPAALNAGDDVLLPKGGGTGRVTETIRTPDGRQIARVEIVTGPRAGKQAAFPVNALRLAGTVAKAAAPEAEPESEPQAPAVAPEVVTPEPVGLTEEEETVAPPVTGQEVTEAPTRDEVLGEFDYPDTGMSHTLMATRYGGYKVFTFDRDTRTPLAEKDFPDEASARAYVEEESKLVLPSPDIVDEDLDADIVEEADPVDSASAPADPQQPLMTGDTYSTVESYDDLPFLGQVEIVKSSNPRSPAPYQLLIGGEKEGRIFDTYEAARAEIQEYIDLKERQDAEEPVSAPAEPTNAHIWREGDIVRLPDGTTGRIGRIEFNPGGSIAHVQRTEGPLAGKLGIAPVNTLELLTPAGQAEILPSQDQDLPFDTPFREGDRVTALTNLSSAGQEVTGTIRRFALIGKRQRPSALLVDTNTNDRSSIFNGVWVPVETLRSVDDPASAPADATVQATPETSSEPQPEVLQSSEEESTPRVLDEPDGVIPGTRALVNDLMGRIESGGIKDNRELAEIAKTHFGGGIASGAYSSADAYDALEAAVNRWVIANASRLMGMDAPVALAEIRDFMKRLPTQNIRTSGKKDLQQFSTPPTLAYLAARVLNPQPDDWVLEPSAGVGGLASWVQGSGTAVAVNEIDPRRAGLLSMLGFPYPSRVNAQHLHSLLPKNIQPTAVLMNPPFSAALNVVKHDSKYGAEHVRQALVRMKDGGRLVAIVGRGMSFDHSTMTPWWKKILNEYTVRANIGLSGKEYMKYGTTFDNQLLVIDKTGPTPGANLNEQRDSVVTGFYETLEDAYEAIRPIIDSRAPLAGAEAGGASVAVDTGRADGGVRGGASATTGGSGLRGDQSGPVPGESDSVAAEARPETVSSGERRSEGERDRTPLEERPVRTGEASDADVQAGNAGRSGLVSDREHREALKARKEESGGAFVSYVPSKVKTGKAHKGNVVETSSMAAVEPPDVKYSPNISPAIAKEGRLSALQLETVTYAGQRHSQTLPDGRRAGFFLGDGTGVGKGRQIAGVVLDNWNQGRKRTLWVSHSMDLATDARRDLDGVGGGAENIKVQPITKLTAKDDWDAKHPEGVIFTTYQSLSSKYEKIKRWLGEDGVIVLDESHKAKNATPEGRAQASKAGLDTIRIQDELPNARVLYSSATGATDVRNMAYMSRLGLWGKGTSFDGFMAFANTISTGGVGAMEVVARDMKALGMYVSRSISYEGVEYKNVEHALTPEQRRIYDTAARAWQLVNRNMEEALEITGGGKRQKGAAQQAYYGAQQNFFNQLIMAMKLPTVIREIEYALENDMSAVVSFINTGESRSAAAVTSAMAEGRDLEEIDVSPKQILIDMVRRAFPVVKYEEFTDDNGKTQTRPMMGPDGKPVEDAEAVAKRDALIEHLERELALPEAPLDGLVNYFGEKKVAELTGRKKRMIVGKDGRRTYKARAGEGISSDKVNLEEMKAFQAGRKRIALISSAASTGISLHSDIDKAKNLQRRYHITWQVDWSADKQMQFFGRTHRTNQKNAPIYVLLHSDVGGERRFISTIARRLESLGALTRGQRDATSGGDLAKYNYESEYGEAALESIYDDLLSRNPSVKNGAELLQRMNILRQDDQGRWEIKKEDRTNVPRFLNRVLALELADQNTLFAAFTERFAQVVQSAKEQGTFDEGIADIRANAIRLKDEETIHADENTGAKTSHYTLEVDMPVQPVTRKMLPEGGEYYQQVRSKRLVYAVPLGMRTDSKTGSQYEAFELKTPKKYAGTVISFTELHTKYNKEPNGTAEWDAQVAAMPKVETKEVHVIAGALLPLWERLQRSGSRLQIVRVKTDDGRRIVGVEIPEDNVRATLRSIGAKAGAMTLADVMKAVRSGEVIELAGGLELRPSRFQGEDAIEIAGGAGRGETLKNMGVIEEYVSFRPRHFVPTDDAQGEAVLTRLLERFPVVSGGEERESLGRPDHRAGGSRPNVFPRPSQFSPTGAAGANPRIDVAPLPGGTPERRPSLIVRDLQRSLNKRVHFGKVGRRRLGEYRPFDSAVVVRREGDFDSLSHEVGHWLSDQFGILAGYAKPRQRSPYDAELIPHFSAYGSSNASSPLEVKRREGLAEWVAAYVKNPDEAKAAAPQFSAYFLGKLPGDAKTTLDAYSDDVRKFFGLPDEERIMANIRMDEPEGETGIAGKIREYFKKQFVRQWLDDMAPAVQGYKEAGRLRGILTDALPTEDFETLMRQCNGKYEKFETIRAFGMIDAKTREIVPDTEGGVVRFLFEPIPHSTYEQANSGAWKTGAYMAAQQTVFLVEEMGWDEKQVFVGANAGLTDYYADYPTAARALRNYLKSPDAGWLKEAAKRYRRIADLSLQYLRDKGRISPARYEQLRKENPFYIDLHRVMEAYEGGLDETVTQQKVFRKTGRSFAAVNQPIQRRTGSGREIANPFTNLLQQVFNSMQEADRNEVLILFTNRLISNRKMHEGQPVPLDTIGRLVPKGEPDAIRMFRNGEEEHWKFAPDIHQAFKGMGQLYSLPFRGANDFLRGLITHDPTFMLYNTGRDTIERWMNTEVGSGLGDFKYSMEDLRDFLLDGGGQFGWFAHNRPEYDKQLKTAMKELTDQGVGTVQKGRNLWHNLGRQSELSNRMAEYMAAKRHAMKPISAGGLGYDKNNARLYAARQARELLDFAVAGSWVRFINQYVWFTNPSIQGVRRMARAIKFNPVRYASKLMLLSMVSLGVRQTWEMQGEDAARDYRNLPAYQRNLFWNFRVFGQTVSLPKSHSVGAASTVLERALDRVEGDPYAFNGFVGGILDSLIPFDETNLVPSLVTPVVETMTNKVFYQGMRPIVSEYETDMPVWERKNADRASRLGHLAAAPLNLAGAAMGNDLQMDPRAADHLIRGYGSRMGRRLMTMSDIGRETRPTAGMELIQQLLGIARPLPNYNAESVQAVLNAAFRLHKTKDAKIVLLQSLLRQARSAQTAQARERARREALSYAEAIRPEFDRLLDAQRRDENRKNRAISGIK